MKKSHVVEAFRTHSYCNKPQIALMSKSNNYAHYRYVEGTASPLNAEFEVTLQLARLQTQFIFF